MLFAVYCLSLVYVCRLLFVCYLLTIRRLLCLIVLLVWRKTGNMADDLEKQSLEPARIPPSPPHTYVCIYIIHIHVNITLIVIVIIIVVIVILTFVSTPKRAAGRARRSAPLGAPRPRLRDIRKKIKQLLCVVLPWLQKMSAHSAGQCLHFSICTCHPRAWAMLIFSASF